MIRKSGLILVTVFIVLIILFDLIFANLLLKSALVKAGESIFGAKTEIKSVNLKIFSGKIDIKNLTVGDKKNEFKNLFEISQISFKVNIMPLFSKKVIIDNIEVENLALSTDRKTSGFLPPKKLEKIEKQKKEKKPGVIDNLSIKLQEKAKEEIKKMPVSKAGDIKDIKNIDLKDKIKPENLESIKRINQAKQNIEEKKQSIKTDIDNLNIGQRADAIKVKAESLKDFKINSPADIPEAQKKIQELDEIKKELGAIKSDVNKAKDKITGFIGFCDNELKEVNMAKEKDIDNIMKNINLNILNANELEKAIIGPVWYERVQTILNLFTLAKKYIPVGGKKDKNKVLEKKREKGTEVVFIKERMLPDFWIKKINISANKSGDGFYLTGNIQDICTEQVITGKPIIFSLLAEKSKKFYSLKGKIDHIEKINDYIEFKAEGLDAKTAGIEKLDIGNVKIKVGTTGFELAGKNTDEKISISGTMNLNNLSYEKNEADLVYQVLSGIDRIKINLNVGFKDAAEISISSDLLDKIKKSIDKIYGKKVTEIKSKINSEIEKQIKEKINELKNSITKNNKELSGIFNSNTDKVKSVEDYIESIKNNITKQIKETQGKAVDDKKKDLLKMFK